MIKKSLQITRDNDLMFRLFDYLSGHDFIFFFNLDREFVNVYDYVGCM